MDFMCGIIGVFNVEKTNELVCKGIAIMKHRGADGISVLNIPHGTLGHCLHAIVGNVKQPIGKGSYLIANCEIYNWVSLINEFGLSASNDSETLYQLLEKFGVEKTLKLIDGDYSCAYFKNDEIFLFRDIFGVKSLWFNLDNFAFASEKKVLNGLGYKNPEDLNPRKILVYNLKMKSFKFIEREFFKVEVNCDDYETAKKKVKGLLVNSIAKRIPDCKFGLLFSGGLDSAFIALILKNLGVDFTCYFCLFNDENFSEPSDLKFALDIAKKLDLNLEVVKVNIKDVQESIQSVVKTIESSNVTKTGVALPFYFASRKAHLDGCKVIISGLGSDEIFAGYGRHKQSADVNKECYSNLLWLYERDLYRDDVITMANNVELRVPFLDNALVEYCLKLNPDFKINSFDKFILRDVAFEMGLPKEFAYRKKVAAQYGSNFDKAIGKLSKLSGFKNKSEYLNKFYDSPNLKLGVLFSGGKDSCYAMYVMQKQNYAIECLISIKSKNEDSFMFHTPNIDLVNLQAEALNIPIVFVNTKGEKEDELIDLKNALEIAKKKYSIQGIVTGALFSNYQRDRIEMLCDKLCLKVFSPLWHKVQLQELKEIVKLGFEVLIVSFASDGFDDKWLGRKIDSNTITDLEKLNKTLGINSAGEGGEYESFVLNGPMFKKKILIEKAKKVMKDKYSGIYIIEKASLAEN